MPLLRFHLVKSLYSPTALAALLEEASVLMAESLYPDTSPLPLERIRVMVSPIEPDDFCVGGQIVSLGGSAAPYFTCISMAGRSQDQIDDLMLGVTQLLVRHLGCDPAIVRGRLIPVLPDHWFIAGHPASGIRKDEIARRREP